MTAPIYATASFSPFSSKGHLAELLASIPYAPKGKMTCAVMAEVITKAREIYWNRAAAEGRAAHRAEIAAATESPTVILPHRAGRVAGPKRVPPTPTSEPGITAAECNEWLATLPPLEPL